MRPYFMHSAILLTLISVTPALAKDIKVSGEDNPYGGGYIRLKTPTPSSIDKPELPESYIQRTPDQPESQSEKLNDDGQVTLQNKVKGHYYKVSDPYACIRKYGGTYVTPDKVSYERAFQTCQKLKKQKEEQELAAAKETAEMQAIAEAEDTAKKIEEEKASKKENEKETKKKGFFAKMKDAILTEEKNEQKKGLNE